MIPSINTPFGSLPTFPLWVVLGILAMFFVTSISLRQRDNFVAEENYIFPKLVLSGMIGLVSAGLLDALFKLPISGEFKITGITFYGGFMGAAASLYIILKATPSKTDYSLPEWFNLLTIPFILFHIFGRIGCFFGGCCYGKETDCYLGVIFPDNPTNNIIHNGAKRYPTQLFEATALMIIFLLLLKRKNKFIHYVFLYAVARFMIEFFRGDERGYISGILSPAQYISVWLLTAIIIYTGITTWKKRHKPDNAAHTKVT